jgi:hypothetical protein
MRKLLLLNLLLTLMLLGCSTSISNIRENPVKYSGKSVSFRGEVTEAFSIPLTGSMIYLLYDKTGTIPVFSKEDREAGDSIKLKAKVLALETHGAVDNVDDVAEKITDYLGDNNLIQGRLVDLSAAGISKVVKIVLAKTQGSYLLIED